MAQYGFYFDNTRCTGCRTCTMACKDYNDLSQTIAFRKVFDYEGGEVTQAEDGTVTSTCFMYHVSRACQHCDNPACVDVCPQQSMQKDEETGLVFNDPEICIGCGSCVNACPYGVPIVDDEAGICVKCNGCYDRTVAGLAPICVEACPLRALEFGPIDELRAAHPDCNADIAPLADPTQTGPNLIVLKSPAAKPFSDTEGIIGNMEEIEGEPARSIFNDYSIVE